MASVRPSEVSPLAAALAQHSPLATAPVSMHSSMCGSCSSGETTPRLGPGSLPKALGLDAVLLPRASSGSDTPVRSAPPTLGAAGTGGGTGYDAAACQEWQAMRYCRRSSGPVDGAVAGGRRKRHGVSRRDSVASDVASLPMTRRNSSLDAAEVAGTPPSAPPRPSFLRAKATPPKAADSPAETPATAPATPKLVLPSPLALPLDIASLQPALPSSPPMKKLPSAPHPSRWRHDPYFAAKSAAAGGAASPPAVPVLPPPPYGQLW